MKQKYPVSLTKTLREYVIISAGLMLFFFAWTGILMPADVIGGGISGLGMIIYYATGGPNGGIPLGLSFLVLNAVLIGLGSFLIGVRFGAKTLYAIVWISVVMSIMQNSIPENILGLADDKLLSVILGGAFAGAGIGICFTQGGSTGGTDIVAMLVNKYKTISYGRVIMLCDLIIIGCSIFVFKNVSTVIYGGVMVAVSGYTVDAVMAGNRQSAQIMIISKRYEEIAEMISSEMHRGVTLIDGMGWYTHQPTQIVMVVCRKYEIGVLFRLIKQIDPDAFMTLGNVMGVYGRGFEALKK
ncbi:MAG: YitT family protein [Alistipes sp.]|nr:YitT family protein [Alistipes sp.]